SLVKGSLATLLAGVGLAGYAFGLEPHVRLSVARPSPGRSDLVPSRFGNRYAYGHIVEREPSLTARERNLIVSGGLGCAILPVRFGVPPEIVLVDVGSA